MLRGSLLRGLGWAEASEHHLSFSGSQEGIPPTHSSRVLPPPRPTSPCCLPLLPACPLLAGALFLASPPGPRCSPSLFRTLLQKELSPFFVMDPRRKQGLLAWTLTQLGCFTLLMVGEKPQSCAKLQSPSPPLLKAWPRHILCVRLVRITRPHQCSHSSPQCPPPGPLDATSLDALYLPTLCTPTMPPAASPVPSPTRSVDFLHLVLAGFADVSN